MTDIATRHRDLDALQLRRTATIGIVGATLGPLLVLTTGSAQAGSLFRASPEAAGIVLIVAGILGRTWFRRSAPRNGYELLLRACFSCTCLGAWPGGIASRGVPPARDPAGIHFRNPPPVSTNLHF